MRVAHRFGVQRERERGAASSSLGVQIERPRGTALRCEDRAYPAEAGCVAKDFAGADDGGRHTSSLLPKDELIMVDRYCPARVWRTPSTRGEQEHADADEA